MIPVRIVVRELGRSTPDFSLLFNLDQLPKPGDYISVFRPDSPTHSEDVVVRHVWWHLEHPEMAAVTSREQAGRMREVLIECDVAVGPYSRDRWREWAKAAEQRGATVVEFDIARFAVSEKDFKEISIE